MGGPISGCAHACSQAHGEENGIQSPHRLGKCPAPELHPAQPTVARFQKEGGREGVGWKGGRKKLHAETRSETETPEFTPVTRLRTGVPRLKIRAEVLVESHVDTWYVPSLDSHTHTLCALPTTPYNKKKHTVLALFKLLRAWPPPLSQPHSLANVPTWPLLHHSHTAWLMSPPGPPPWPGRRRGGTWA